MSYRSLYREFRPLTFDEVVGQEPITRAIQNQVESDRISHAYLFSGTRGTGKTTLAKIMARAVNCEHPVNGNPCNQCPACLAALRGASPNVIEIDAASNNGIESIRMIQEEVRYRPAEGRYKVYIIDEAHMLTPQAANALLKTLEEPPEYIIFILATTELHKIPITVRSRCQRYDVRRIPMDKIAERLRLIMDSEGIEAEEAAVSYLSYLGDGSLRDAISLLEQARAYFFDRKLTYEDLLDVLGSVDRERFLELYEAVLQKNPKEAYGIVAGFVEAGRDLARVLSDFISYLRDLMMVQSDALRPEEASLSTEAFEKMKRQAYSVSVECLIRDLTILNHAVSTLRNSTTKRLVFELTLLRMMNAEMGEDTESLLVRLEDAERRLSLMEERGVAAPKGSSHTEEAKEKPVKSESAPQGEKKASPRKAPSRRGDGEEEMKDWGAFLRPLKSGFFEGILRKAKPLVTADHRLIFCEEDRRIFTLLESATVKADLEELIQEAHGIPYTIECRRMSDLPRGKGTSVEKPKGIAPGITIDEEE